MGKLRLGLEGEAGWTKQVTENANESGNGNGSENGNENENASGNVGQNERRGCWKRWMEMRTGKMENCRVFWRGSKDEERLLGCSGALLVWRVYESERRKGRR